jgi:predicted homoserine dehydrogenase-like protein
LRAGEELDGIGGFTCYGVIDNADIVNRENLLPMSLAEGCRLKCDLKKDQTVTYANVMLPTDRICDRLRSEQNKHFVSPRGPTAVAS